MANNMWAFDLENTIFSIIKARATAKLKSKYPNIRFTSTDLPKDTTTQYPTVYLHALGGSPEQGRTMEGNKINGTIFTMQSDVTTNKSKNEAKTVNAEIACLFEGIGFRIEAFPQPSTIGNNYISSMRVRRTFGNEDTI